MIILHNELDKTSRDFVESCHEGNVVLNYPDCVKQFPYISAFPSVVVEVPSYKIPIFEGQPERIMPDDLGIIRLPKDWDDVLACVNHIYTRSKTVFTTFEEFQAFEQANIWKV